MKKLISIFTVIFVFFAIFSGDAAAQKKEPSKDSGVEVLANIAVMDMIAVRGRAKAFKNLRKQISSYREKLKKDARLEDTDLQKANRELARQRAILTPAAFSEERKKFEARVGKAQQDLQERWRTLKDVEQEAEAKILTALQQTTVKVAQNKDLILILRKQAIIFWADTLDVTSDIIARLDKKMPSVKVLMPKSLSSTSAEKKKSSKKK